ncbi:MAG TPA: OmpH family outer membrane protein [Opitutales bacterium]|jgi:Skp family chaperone for outer membrane proteins|nr:OmpH family outer membrane protein [Opitutales bacterium]
MKKILIPALVAVLSTLSMHAQSILVVDVNGVFNNLTEVKETLVKINNLTNQYKDFLTTHGQALQDLQNKANSITALMNAPLTSNDTRDNERQQLNEVTADMEKERSLIQSFYQQSNDLITKQQQALVTSELDKIKTAVSTIADQKHATLVLNSSALGMLAPVVYSGDKMSDISDAVTKQLNDDYTKLAGASAAPADTGTMTLPAMTPTAKPAASTAKPAATK